MVCSNAGLIAFAIVGMLAVKLIAAAGRSDGKCRSEKDTLHTFYVNQGILTVERRTAGAKLEDFCLPDMVDNMTTATFPSKRFYQNEVGCYDMSLRANYRVRSNVTSPCRLKSCNISTLFVALERFDASGSFTIPTGLFVNLTDLTRLEISAAAATNLHSDLDVVDVRRIEIGTFDGLENLAELHLIGFEKLESVDDDVFAPLRNLNSLVLVGFGRQNLTFDTFSLALAALSDAPLRHVAMKDVHSVGESVLNVGQLFQVFNETLESVVFVGNDVHAVDGRLSRILPQLKCAHFSFPKMKPEVLNFCVDSLSLHSNLTELKLSFDHKPTAKEIVDDLFRRRLLVNILDPDIASALIDRFDSEHGIVLSPNLKTLTVNIMEFLILVVMHAVTGSENISFNKANMLEYVDLSGSDLHVYNTAIRELTNLEYVNLEGTALDAKNFSMKTLHAMPRLKTLLLGRNRLGTLFSDDTESTSFRPLTKLETLDLTNCSLSTFPVGVFSALPSLRHLSLSQNKIQVFNISLNGLRHLQVLNLSDNQLRHLSKTTRSQFDELTSAETNESARIYLVVDLSRNNLSCLCDVNDFVRWWHQRNLLSRIKFYQNSNYLCRYPNDSVLPIGLADMPGLEQQCSAFENFIKNPICPCDDDIITSLRRLRSSVVDLFCTNLDKKVKLTTILDAAANGPKFWCEDFLKDPKFLSSMTVLSVLVIAILVLIIILFRRRKTDAVRRLTDCIDVGTYFRTAMVLLEWRHRRHARPPPDLNFDAFFYYHDDDANWTRETVIDRIDDCKTTSVDDFFFGSNMIEKILESIAQSRTVILILSPRFFSDSWCREAAVRAYASKPQAVIPIVYEEFEVDAADVLMSNVLTTSDPIYWTRSEMTTLLVARIRERIRGRNVHKIAFSRINSA